MANSFNVKIGSPQIDLRVIDSPITFVDDPDITLPGGVVISGGMPVVEMPRADETVIISGDEVDVSIETTTQPNNFGSFVFNASQSFRVGHRLTPMRITEATPFTVSVWLKRTGISSKQFIWGRMLDLISFNGIAFYMDSGNLLTFELVGNVATGNLIKIVGTTVLTDTDDFHNLVVTYDGLGLASSILIYLDGVDITNGTPVIDNFSGSITTNEEFTYGEFFNGTNTDGVDYLLNDMGFFNRVLTPVEVAEINTLLDGDLNTHSAASNIRNYSRASEVLASNFPRIIDSSGNNDESLAINMSLFNLSIEHQ